MRYEYIEPLIATAKKVLVEVLDGEITYGETTLVKGDDLNADVSILISMTGDSDGHVIIGLDRTTAARISSVMKGEPCDPPISFDIDIVCELSNMIAGNAAGSLNDLGHDFTVFPPKAVSPEEIRRKTEGIEIFRVPLVTPCGEISMNVALKAS